MATRSNLVNLDAMITREDFSVSDEQTSSFENVSTISLRDFTSGGLIGPSLRKPDFQRETNHWSPEQVVSLLECFINGDLIPSVILWQSPTYLFVIDGGHRLSVLKAWIEDDYGDGPSSQAFFGYEISDEQKRIAKHTRNLVDNKIGKWTHFAQQSSNQNLPASERKKLNAVISRGLPIQWVKGDSDKAEASFFKINTKGTPLDEVEELLLKNRKKSISIASRAIIRSGTGHRYWSAFSEANTQKIESLSKQVHTILFDPEIKSPVKTLDLPLGGPKGVRTAIQALIDLCLIAARNQKGEPKTINGTPDDVTGTETIKVLNNVLKLSKRVTGNDTGSLGLHPAVYFYGPTGRHSTPMFMGTMSLIGRKIINNDRTFFRKFITVREKLERTLISEKDLIATILQKQVSKKRVESYATLLDNLISHLSKEESIDSESLIKMSGLEGKIVVGTFGSSSTDFSADEKSKTFISRALTSALKCPICNGYLDVTKSVSYDHIQRKQDGGTGSSSNCELTHPYCNQTIKN